MVPGFVLPMDSYEDLEDPNQELLDLLFIECDSIIGNDITLVGKVFPNKTINFQAINSVLSTAWNLGSNVLIKHMDINPITCHLRTKRTILAFLKQVRGQLKVLPSISGIGTHNSHWMN